MKKTAILICIFFIFLSSQSEAAKKAVHKPRITYWDYVVRPGDDFSLIACLYLEDSSPSTIKAEARRLGLKNPDLIYPGQVFKLPHVIRWNCKGKAGKWSRDFARVEKELETRKKKNSNCGYEMKMPF